MCLCRHLYVHTQCTPLSPAASTLTHPLSHSSLCKHLHSHAHSTPVSSAGTCPLTLSDLPTITSADTCITCPQVSYPVMEHSFNLHILCYQHIVPSRTHCPTLCSVLMCTQMSTKHLFSAGSCAHMATDHLSLCRHPHSKSY